MSLAIQMDKRVTLQTPPAGRNALNETAGDWINVVLEGDGTALLGDRAEPIGPGSVIVRPPGGSEAHALRAGAEPLTYLAYGTRVPGDVVFYPRSQKLLVGDVAFRVDRVGYWDGEA